MRLIGKRSNSGLRRFIVGISALHLALYRRSGGRVGRRLGLKHGLILLLTTTGRRTGELRTVPLLAVEDGASFVVIASHGGLDQPPAWLLNLRADPRATAEVGGRTVAVRAEQVDGDKRAELWQRFMRAFPGYHDYRGRTTREFPIFILHSAA